MLGAILMGTASVSVASVGRYRALAAPRPGHATVSEQPPPSSSPQSPGIMIASLDGIDLTGPWLVDHAGLYYLFVSTAFGDSHDNVPLLVGKPGSWSGPVDALANLPVWATPAAEGGNTWQPEVYRVGRRWVLYFAALVKGTQPPEHCIGTAVSPTVAGPYRPSPQPLVCQLDEGGDIDAQVVADPSSRHRLYLVWKSDNNALPGGGGDLIWSQPLADSGLSLLDTPTVIFGSQAAPPWSQPIVEAPQLVRSPSGSWWLFYSGGVGFSAGHYAIGVARCLAVTGPCVASGDDPLISSNDQGAGPGEESVFQHDGSVWVLYSPWHSGIPLALFRPVAAARLGWGASGPYVASAGSFPPP